MRSLSLSYASKPPNSFSTKEESRRSQTRNQTKFPKLLASPILAGLIAFSPLSYTAVSYAQQTDPQSGAALFNKSCIGCHDGGGNILQPGATLFMKDLKRNNVDTIEGIYMITYYGKGRMPGFGEKCTPRGQCTFGARLQDEEIKLLAEFVKLQADRGWTNVQSSGD